MPLRGSKAGLQQATKQELSRYSTEKSVLFSVSAQQDLECGRSRHLKLNSGILMGCRWSQSLSRTLGFLIEQICVHGVTTVTVETCQLLYFIHERVP